MSVFLHTINRNKHSVFLESMDVEHGRVEKQTVKITSVENVM